MGLMLIASASWGEWDVSPETLALLTGTILPLIVGFITALEAPPILKILLLAFLAGVTGYLTNVASVTGQVEFWPIVLAGLLAIVAAWGAHKNVWQPTGTTQKVQASGPQLGARRAA